MPIKPEPVTPAEVVESWVHSYSDSLYTWALYKTSSKELAEDLVQETFLAAHLQFDKFRNDSNPKTWLTAILKNKISEHYRKRYRNPTSSDVESSASGSSLFDLMFDENNRWNQNQKPQAWEEEEDPHLLDNEDFNAMLKTCLGKLPENWHSAIYLKYIEQKKGDLICQELGIAPTNFWQVLHRAKLQIRKCLELHWFKPQS